MKLREFAAYLAQIKPELQDKEVKIQYQNGIIGTAEVKFVLKDRTNPFDKSADNVEYIIIC